jgi:lysyl-tRNA synthetase class 1
MAHWADEIAGQIVARGGVARISTGISPSGQIHIGNLREVVTADAVYRALRDLGAQAEFHYVADNFDPLRHVYPFLDAAVYAPLIGRPLSEIPAPGGAPGNYADYFLEPFLRTLGELGIRVEVFKADQMYKSGRMNGVIVEALRGRDTIAAILHELTGKKVEDDWSPFLPLCEACGRITAARVTGFDAAAQTVSYACECSHASTRPMAGAGKLTWRVDWPARWKELGVTVEPFGKDHATRGGSYDTGARISREVFGSEPPFPIMYEWISLKGRGDMSSSKGNVLSIAQMVDVVPADVLRYLIVRTRPAKAIPFDPGLPLLSLVDEFDGGESSAADPRSLELARAGGAAAPGVPFKHLVTVLQIAGGDADETLRVLERSGYPGLDRKAVERRIVYARRWLEQFAPEDMKFSVQAALPESAANLPEPQRAFLRDLASGLADGMTAEEIHQAIYAAAAGHPELPSSAMFEAIYESLLGRKRGPRAGWFIALLGPGRCAARFREAADAPVEIPGA